MASAGVVNESVIVVVVLVVVAVEPQTTGQGLVSSHAKFLCNRATDSS